MSNLTLSCIVLALIVVASSQRRNPADKPMPKVNPWGIADQTVFNHACSPRILRFISDASAPKKSGDVIYMQVTIESQKYYGGIKDRRHGQPYPIGNATKGDAPGSAQSVYSIRPYQQSQLKQRIINKNGLYYAEAKTFVGCPASLCTTSGIDFLNYKATYKQVFAQVGPFDWQVTPRLNPYLTADNPRRNGFLANAALNFPELRLTMFLQDKGYEMMYERPIDDRGTPDFTYHSLHKADGFKDPDNSIFKGYFPDNVDAATVQQYLGDYYIYAFSGEGIHKYKAVFPKDTSKLPEHGKEFTIQPFAGYPKPMSDFNKNWQGADEVFYDPLQSVLIVIKGFYFYTQTVIGSLDNAMINEKVTFKTSIHRGLFDCRDEVYEAVFTPDFGLGDFETQMLDMKVEKDEMPSHPFQIAFFVLLIVVLLGLLGASIYVIHHRMQKIHHKHESRSVNDSRRGPSNENLAMAT